MKAATEVPKEALEVTQFPTIIFGYQMAPKGVPFVFVKHVPDMKSEAATSDKVWSLVNEYSSNYNDTPLFQLRNPSIGRPFFGDAERSPWEWVDQEQDKPFVFLGLLTDSTNFVWGAMMPDDSDGWGFCERVAYLLFGKDAMEKVVGFLKEMHEGGQR